MNELLALLKEWGPFWGPLALCTYVIVGTMKRAEMSCRMCASGHNRLVAYLTGRPLSPDPIPADPVPPQSPAHGDGPRPLMA